MTGTTWWFSVAVGSPNADWLRQRSERSTTGSPELASWLMNANWLVSHKVSPLKLEELKQQPPNPSKPTKTSLLKAINLVESEREREREIESYRLACASIQVRPDPWEGQGFVCARGNRIVCARGDGDRLYTRGSSAHAASACGLPKQCGHSLGSYGRCKGRVLIQGAQMCVRPVRWYLWCSDSTCSKCILTVQTCRICWAATCAIFECATCASRSERH